MNVVLRCVQNWSGRPVEIETLGEAIQQRKMRTLMGAKLGSTLSAPGTQGACHVTRDETNSSIRQLKQVEPATNVPQLPYRMTHLHSHDTRRPIWQFKNALSVAVRPAGSKVARLRPWVGDGVKWAKSADSTSRNAQMEHAQ